MEYVDDTNVEVDNRDLTNTVLRYPRWRVSVSIGFAIDLVKNAFENAGLPTEEIDKVRSAYNKALE